MISSSNNGSLQEQVKQSGNFGQREHQMLVFGRVLFSKKLCSVFNFLDKRILLLILV